MSGYAIRVCGLILASSLVFSSALCAAAGDRSTEYKVKAAYIYNFVKFVKWPADTLSRPSDALTICSAAADPLDGALADAIKDKTVDVHPLALRRVGSEADLKDCQVLFLSGKDSRKLATDLVRTHFPGLLTIFDDDAPATDKNSRMISFVFESDRIRFSINQESAERAGLTISSKLLSLAVKSEAR
jgi:hypothetical protein